MVTKACSLDGCDRTPITRGWCKMHYSRWQKTGEPGSAGRMRTKWLNKCAVAECANIVGTKGARGWCTKHYQMFLKSGDPTGSAAPTEAERFWPRVQKTETCWLWTGGGDKHGYGHFSAGGWTRKAHRWAYEALVGPIPDGLVLDHLCRTPACVNPSHLEAVTNQENLERGWGRRVKSGWVDHCIRGHKFTPDNTYVNARGSFACRVCSAASQRRYEQRKKVA